MKRNRLPFSLFLLTLPLCGAALYFLGAVRPALIWMLFAACSAGLFLWSPRIMLYLLRAVPVSKEEAEDLWFLAERLAEKAGIVMPRLYVLPNASANLIVLEDYTGRGLVGVSYGLFQTLNSSEFSGILAWAVCRIKQRGLFLEGVVNALQTFLALPLLILAVNGNSRGEFGRDFSLQAKAFLFSLLTAPLLILDRIYKPSAENYFEIDRQAALLCGNPYALAEALSKMHGKTREFSVYSASLFCANLFLLKPRFAGLPNVNSRHPAAESRIARLIGQNEFTYD